jgi:hypothetical protein
MLPRPMGVPASEVGYISATTGRGDQEVYMDMWWHWWGGGLIVSHILQTYQANLAFIGTAHILGTFQQ